MVVRIPHVQLNAIVSSHEKGSRGERPVTDTVETNCYRAVGALKESLNSSLGGSGDDFEDYVGLTPGSAPEDGVSTMAAFNDYRAETIWRIGPAVKGAVVGYAPSVPSVSLRRAKVLHLRPRYCKRSIGAELASRSYL